MNKRNKPDKPDRVRTLTAADLRAVAGGELPDKVEGGMEAVRK